MAFSPDELRGCQAFAGLPSSGVVVGVDEEREVVSQLVVVVMVGPFDGRLLIVRFGWLAGVCLQKPRSIRST